MSIYQQCVEQMDHANRKTYNICFMLNTAKQEFLCTKRIHIALYENKFTIN